MRIVFENRIECAEADIAYDKETRELIFGGCSTRGMVPAGRIGLAQFLIGLGVGNDDLLSLAAASAGGDVQSRAGFTPAQLEEIKKKLHTLLAKVR